MISAILLAAGQSKRMEGENKLVKEIQGVPLIKRSVENILSSSIDELIVVVGYQKEIVEKIIHKHEKVKFVFNKNYEIGMASSIKMGLIQYCDRYPDNDTIDAAEEIYKLLVNERCGDGILCLGE